MKKMMPKTLRAKADVSRQNLLRSAMVAFAAKGYYGTSVRDIVAPLKCSPNQVIYHFGSKEGIAEAVVMKLKETLVLPTVYAESEIVGEAAWRSAVRHYVEQVIELFLSQEEPNCYFSSLYRFEIARITDKRVTLHEEIVRPLFRRLEGLLACGRASGDACRTRLCSLGLWNSILAFVLKPPSVLAEDFPAGMPPRLFRAVVIDYMMEKALGDLTWRPACAPSADAGV